MTGFLIIIGVIVVAVLVIGTITGAIGKVTRREERGGNVHDPDDPQQRPPRA